MISRLKSTKKSENEQKKGGLVFVYSLNLVGMQKLVDYLRGYLEIVFFRLIFLICLRTMAGYQARCENLVCRVGCVGFGVEYSNFG